MATKINLSSIASIVVLDPKTQASILYKRKEGAKVFKLTYQYDEKEEGKAFCSRCGVEYDDPDGNTPCPECKEDEYQIIDAADIADMVYESLESSYVVTIEQWDGTSQTFTLDQ